MQRLLGFQDRERRALEQVAHGLAQRVAAGDEHAGDGRDRRGHRRGEARDQDVRPVAGDDDERPFDEVVDEVLDAHRGDSYVAHVPLQRLLAGAGDDLGAELVRDLADGRKGELRQLGQDVDRLASVLRAERAAQLLDSLGGNAVDDDAEDRAALVRERVSRRPD